MQSSSSAAGTICELLALPRFHWNQHYCLQIVVMWQQWTYLQCLFRQLLQNENNTEDISI